MTEYWNLAVKNRLIQTLRKFLELTSTRKQGPPHCQLLGEQLMCNRRWETFNPLNILIKIRRGRSFKRQAQFLAHYLSQHWCCDDSKLIRPKFQNFSRGANFNLSPQSSQIYIINFLLPSPNSHRQLFCNYHIRFITNHSLRKYFKTLGALAWQSMTLLLFVAWV